MFQEKPVISEIESTSSTHIKMAPLSLNPAKLQEASISTQNTHSPNEETDGDGSVLHGSSTQLNGNYNQTVSGEVPAISVGMESSAESDAYKDGHETELKKVEVEEACVTAADDGPTHVEANIAHPQHQMNKMANNLCTTNDGYAGSINKINYSQDDQMMDNQLLGQTSSMNESPCDNNIAYGHTKVSATGHKSRRHYSTGSLMRKKTKKEQLEELNHLPSIKNKCHILQQRIKGGYEDSDDDVDKPSSTTILVIENRLASLQVEQTMSDVDDIPSTFRSVHPQQVKPQKSPWGDNQPIAPIVVSETPHNRYVYTNTDATKLQTLKSPWANDQPIEPTVISPTHQKYVYTNSECTEPHLQPIQSPMIPKRREVPMKDCIDDEVDPDMPPPPPLATHPEVIAARKKKKATLGTSRPRGAFGEAGRDDEDQDDVFDSLVLHEDLQIQEVTSPKSVSSIDTSLSDSQHLPAVQPHYSFMNTRRWSLSKKKNFFKKK